MLTLPYAFIRAALCRKIFETSLQICLDHAGHAWRFARRRCMLICSISQQSTWCRALQALGTASGWIVSGELSAKGRHAARFRQSGVCQRSSSDKASCIHDNTLPEKRHREAQQMFVLVLDSAISGWLAHCMRTWWSRDSQQRCCFVILLKAILLTSLWSIQWTSLYT